MGLGLGLSLSLDGKSLRFDKQIQMVEGKAGNPYQEATLQCTILLIAAHSQSPH
ncbi:GL19815 [Drosophila persimilis]|uniref:GL19815 n=1 Tax=Drosophila persimilis TaxID=7234 RepID=B4GYE8_DROPE|nr:GL19815 [Drosophila persimilis]